MTIDLQAVSGAQAISRACFLMMEVARSGQSGARLVELQKSSGLSHSTVHRILQSLVGERFIVQDAASKRYRLGHAIFELGLAAPSPLDHLSELRPILSELAQRIGDTAYLMMRRGDEIICLARAEGASPIRTYMIEVGEMRPIGASLAGICLMATMEDDEVERTIRRTELSIARYGEASPAYIRRQIAHVRSKGFCISREVLLKMATGMSMAVPNAKGAPFLGISISAVSSRVPDRRVPLLAEELMTACMAMGAALING
ncbi:IclR family transcriptional regulator [Rhizobium rhizogenes]|uniref:IclR family transcriptional regulator n=1 Tax=Rhizobium rhizogenes TaxID=359 RepID=UPI001573552F|nr:IclR family transcriptional regulator [Rhizobium rhizogenes]NTI78535.1 IclR family transcriptional regulator [Rhizobium rhizogenes]